MKTLRNILANTLLFATALGLYQACVPPTQAVEVEITLNLSWTDNADNEDGIKVYYRNDPDVDFSVLEILPTPDVETYVFIVSVSGGEVFQFQVTAFNQWLGQEQESGGSNIATYSVPLNSGAPVSPSAASVVLGNLQ